ncbi:hypothetical protein MY10362_005938 [Beauveria mimosiformis]
MASQNQDNAQPTACHSVAKANAPTHAAPTEVLKSFEGFLSFILTLSIFGASTFTIIVSEIADPSHGKASPGFTRDTVRALLGGAWLLFVLALGLVALSMSLLALQREHAALQFDGPRRNAWEHLGLFGVSLIQLFVISAFVLLSIVLVAYTKTVGWIAVAITSTAAAFTLTSLIVQWQ